jgi:hypothetical protein
LTVTQVLPLRTELVSAVHLNLFACAAAFRSLRPLPQFLPSSRHALEVLLDAVHDQLDAPPDSADLVFAFAEAEVLEELVETVVRLVELTRAWFGTQTFLTGDEAWHSTTGTGTGTRASASASGTATPIATGVWEGYHSPR